MVGFERLAACQRPRQGCLLRLGVLARRSRCLSRAFIDRRMARLGVVGSVCAAAGNWLIGGGICHSSSDGMGELSTLLSIATMVRFSFESGAGVI